MKKKLTYNNRVFKLDGYRNKFKDIAEIEQFIKDNNLTPQKTYNTKGQEVFDKFYIYETVEKTYTLQSENVYQLSDELVQKVINLSLSKIDNRKANTYADYNGVLGSLHYRIYPDELSHSPIVRKAIEQREPINHQFYLENKEIIDNKLDYENEPRNFSNMIKNLLNGYNVYYSKDNIELFRLYTDYKPCNGIAIKFDETFGNFYIVCRKDSICISKNAAYGHNVNERKRTLLIESDLNEFC